MRTLLCSCVGVGVGCRHLTFTHGVVCFNAQQPVHQEGHHHQLHQRRDRCAGTLRHRLVNRGSQRQQHAHHLRRHVAIARRPHLQRRHHVLQVRARVVLRVLLAAAAGTGVADVGERLRAISQAIQFVVSARLCPLSDQKPSSSHNSSVSTRTLANRRGAVCITRLLVLPASICRRTTL